MFSKTEDQRDLNGFLDRGSRMQGELTFEASFRIDGNFEGTVRSSGRLVVGEGGVVEGEVHVRHVLVTGEVRGSVEAGEQIHIAPGGRLLADITTPSLVIEDGAVFEGKCVMNRDKRSGGAGAGGKGGESVAKLVAGG
jgi:cytoskeletal protein CcmA (bactofilin family)